MSKRLLHVLVLDDDELNNVLIKEIILCCIPIREIFFETSGWDALDYLEEKKKQSDFPDLIIVDIKMPEMDGFEFIEKYESAFYKDFKSTQIAVITSSSLEFDRLKASLFPSVNFFINKPLDEKKLQQITKELYDSKDY